LLYHFLLALGLHSPIFNSIDSQMVAVVGTLLFAILNFLYGQSYSYGDTKLFDTDSSTITLTFYGDLEIPVRAKRIAQQHPMSKGSCGKSLSHLAGFCKPSLTKPKPKPSPALILGPGLYFCKPKPTQAQPKLGPAHH
jgi:hypothetical protein